MPLVCSASYDSPPSHKSSLVHGSVRYIANPPWGAHKKFDTKVPGATPFQEKLKEYELKAPTVGMFGEISKDGESILEIAAWKRADEYCTFFASKPQVSLEDQAADAP